MWPNAFGGTGLCRNSNQSGSPQNGNRKRRAETGGGRSIGGNRERYVESLSCGVFLQRNSSRAHTKLSVTVDLAAGWSPTRPADCLFQNGISPPIIGALNGRNGAILKSGRFPNGDWMLAAGDRLLDADVW